MIRLALAALLLAFGFLTRIWHNAKDHWQHGETDDDFDARQW